LVIGCGAGAPATAGLKLGLLVKQIFDSPSLEPDFLQECLFEQLQLVGALA